MVLSQPVPTPSRSSWPTLSTDANSKGVLIPDGTLLEEYLWLWVFHGSKTCWKMTFRSPFLFGKNDTKKNESPSTPESGKTKVDKTGMELHLPDSPPNVEAGDGFSFQLQHQGNFWDFDATPECNQNHQRNRCFLENTEPHRKFWGTVETMKHHHSMQLWWTTSL